MGKHASIAAVHADKQSEAGPKFGRIEGELRAPLAALDSRCRS